MKIEFQSPLFFLCVTQLVNGIARRTSYIFFGVYKLDMYGTYTFRLLCLKIILSRNY